MTDQPEPAPTPKRRMRLSSPNIHILPPSGQGYVIGGVSGFTPSPEGKSGDEPPPATDETPGKPTLVLLDAKQAERSRTEVIIMADDQQATDATKQKPHLYLLPSEDINFENVMKMFEALKGRPPTEEERAEALREWESDDGESKDSTAEVNRVE